MWNLSSCGIVILLFLTAHVSFVQTKTDINLSLYSNPKPNNNEDYIVVKTGDQLELQCESSKPLEGFYLRNLDFDSYDPKMKEMRNVNWQSAMKWDPQNYKLYTPPKNDLNYTFGIALKISFIDTKHIGWQVCFVNEQIYKYLFIFVEDRFSQPTNIKYHVLKYKSNENITLPCITPSPDIPVNLQYSTGYSFQYESLKTLPKQLIYGYDPRIGYKIAPINSHTNYICFYSQNGLAYSSTMTVIIDDDVDSFTPTFNNKYSTITRLNTDLKMECIFVNLKNLNISLRWTTPSAIEDKNDTDIIKYKINLMNHITVHVTSLKIKKVSVHDVGYYKCSVIDFNDNEIGFSVRQIFVKANVTNKTKPTIHNNNTTISIKEDGNLLLRCTASYPIAWTFVQSEQNNKNPRNIFIYSPVIKYNLTYESILNINMATHENIGYYYCHEINTSLEDEDVLYQKIFIYIYRDLSTLVFIPNEKVTKINVQKYSSNVLVSCIPIQLNTNCSIEEFNEKKTIVTNKTNFQYELNFSTPIYEDMIFHCACRRTDLSNRYMSNIIIKTYESFSENTLPYINLKYNKNVSIGNKLEIQCTIVRYCKQCNISNEEINISWLYNGNSPNIAQRININNKFIPLNNAELYLSTLTINESRKSDSYQYECFIDKLHSKINIIINDGEIVNVYQEYMTIIIIGITCIVLLTIGVILVLFMEQIKLQKTIRKAGLSNFHKGTKGVLNPRIYINLQTDILPYDPNLEIPRNKIKIGQQLVSDNFGTVFEGELSNQFSGKFVKTVAIKMVKKNMKYTHMKSLIHELKILSIIGKHVNIINLLGACTEKINKMELIVVFEYCRYGNIRNFLRKNRNSFMNQTNLESDIISKVNDYNKNIGKLEENSNFNSQITTNTLLNWAYQISCGMEYLATRKVLHGDLAARNVLLSENNIIKICEFGILKKYNIHNYKENAELPISIKWMAIESIRDQIYSTQSDIWSFGILLWELFTLADTPYADIKDNMDLYKLISNGYRMEQPKYATKELYLLMLKCWEHIPKNRPSFSFIRNFFEVDMDANQLKHTIEMNEGNGTEI